MYQWRFVNPDTAPSRPFDLPSPSIGSVRYPLHEMIEHWKCRYEVNRTGDMFLERVRVEPDKTITVLWSAPNATLVLGNWLLEHADYLVRTDRAERFAEASTAVVAAATAYTEAAARAENAAVHGFNGMFARDAYRSYAINYARWAQSLTAITPVPVAMGQTLSALPMLSDPGTVEAAKNTVKESANLARTAGRTANGCDGAMFITPAHSWVINVAVGRLRAMLQEKDLNNIYYDAEHPSEVDFYLTMAGFIAHNPANPIGVSGGLGKIVGRYWWRNDPEPRLLIEKLDTAFMALAPDGYSEP